MSKTCIMAAIDRQNMAALTHCILYLLLLQLRFGITSGEIQEYCSHEDFAPRCGDDEVIVMTHAVYGRMRLGKCIKSSMGYIDCKTDVLSILDGLCSNKQQCSVLVHTGLSTNQNVQNSCPSELLKYLEADYECEKVLQIKHTTCRSASNDIEISASAALSSDDLVQNLCGASSFRLTARPGQQLNITITDFNWDESRDITRSCINYLELKEASSLETTPVCAGTRRNRHVMTTDNNEVMATFHIQDPNNQRFLIKFEAIGCGDITPPEGTWVQRDGDETTLGCHSGKHTWTLRCEHNQWVGAVGSCGTGLIPTEKTIHEEETDWQDSIAPGMVVFAVCSLFLLLSSSAFTIGVCLYTKSSNATQKKDSSEQVRFGQDQTLLKPLPVGSARTMQWNVNPSLPRQAGPQPTNVFPNQTANPQNKQIKDSYIHREQRAERTSPNDETMYCNTMRSQTDSTYSDSVKYYVLENTNEQNT